MLLFNVSCCLIILYKLFVAVEVGKPTSQRNCGDQRSKNHHVGSASSTVDKTNGRDQRKIVKCC